MVKRIRFGIAAAAVLGGLLPAARAAEAPRTAPAQFQADFSQWAGMPLVKTKFGVYETPFLKKDDLHRAAALLPEAGVQDLRYEMGWGKPDAYAFDQISGTAAKPQIDFAPLDPFVRDLKQYGVTPLFAMTYDPVPLKTGTEWQRWKDVPTNLAAWQEIQRRYADHYRRSLGLAGPLYEIWNEPDIPGDGGKMFFSGSAADYANVYRTGAAGIRAGDSEAAVGGPAIAYDLSYARPLTVSPLPDFLSIHAYNNFAGQLTSLRSLVKDQPAVPLLLTEYASFTSYGPAEPVSRHPAAARFFRDVEGLLAFSDVPKVYWAQWVDDSIGFLTRDFHRKALFNAYTIYQKRLPVDRNTVKSEGADGLNALAASDDHTAGIVLWNEASSEKAATVRLDHLPFKRGTMHLYRIDSSHASYGDDPKTEKLSVDGAWEIYAGHAEWAGTIPGESVVFLQASDGSGASLLRPRQIGAFVRCRYWFPDRASDAYADFDPHTSIIRIGQGQKAMSAAQIGIVLDKPVATLQVQVTRQGPFAPQNRDSLFGLRVEYGSRQGGTGKSILWKIAGKAHTGKPFRIEIAGNAPARWNGRIVLTPILRNMGAGSCARIILEPR